MFGTRGGRKSNNFHGEPYRCATDRRIGDVGETHVSIGPEMPRSLADMVVKQIWAVPREYSCVLLQAARGRMVFNVPAFDDEGSQVLQHLQELGRGQRLLQRGRSDTAVGSGDV